ncbi:hypothetical protein D7V97_38675 [Corallococcus sp. CA053C]|nr:hypothetical protein D7V97_38675 [Corallococcus sp. CA053C]
MAVGLLAGCGGMPEAESVESAEPGTRTDSLYHTFICCDSTECTGTAAICNQYCQQEERGGICS